MGSIVSSFGVSLGVRTNASGIWQRIVDRLPAGSRPLPGDTMPWVYSLWVAPPSELAGVRPLNVLYRNCMRLARSPELGDILGRFESEFRAAVAVWSPRMTFLRAAGLRVDDRTVLVACESERGEDPLVEALLRQGGAPIAREFAPLDREGELAPYLSRRSLGGQPPGVSSGAMPIDVVVLPARVENGSARLERVGRALATVELVATALTVNGSPDAQLAVLTKLARRAAVVRLFYADPLLAAAEVRRLLASLRFGS